MAKPAPICVRSVMFTRANNNVKPSGSDGRTLEGYGAVFDSPARINSWAGSFDERIARGAFEQSLGERTPKLQFDHGHDKRTGSVPIGAVEEVREDDHGLYVRARLFENSVVEPIRQAIEAGAIDGMSFRFEVEDEEWRDSEGVQITRDEELDELMWHPGDRGPLQRTIKRAKVFELGPVVFPAYDSTSVGVRSFLDQVGSEEREELISEVVRRLEMRERKASELTVQIDYDDAKLHDLIEAAFQRYKTPSSEEEPVTNEARSEEVEETPGQNEKIRSETEEVDEPTDIAGQSGTRSADGSETDAESREDEASTPSAAVIAAEQADERKRHERRIRDAHLRKIGVLK